jgi:hypothetical protein
MTLIAGGDIGKTAEYGLLNPTYLPGAITIGATIRFTTRLTAPSMAQGTIFNAGYTYLFFATKGRLLKGDSEPAVEVSTTLWSLTGGRSRPTEKSVKDVTEAAKIKPLKTSPKNPPGTTKPKAVIGSPPVLVR